MAKIIIRYKKKVFWVEISESNIHISDSFRVKSIKDMKAILMNIKRHTLIDYPLNKKTLRGMINEWRTHNLLYSLGILRNRTGSVDLAVNQHWYFKILYAIGSIFYLHYK